MDGNVSDTPPVIVVPRSADRDRWLALQREQAGAKAKLKQLAESQGPAAPKPKAPLEDASQLYARPGETTFAAKQTIDLPNQPAFDSTRPFTLAFWLKMPKTEDSLVVLSQMVQGNEKRKTKSRGWLFEIGARVANFRVTVTTAVARRPRRPPQSATARHLDPHRHHLRCHRERMGFGMYFNGPAHRPSRRRAARQTQGKLRQPRPRSASAATAGGSFEGGAIRDLRIYNRALSEDDARLVSLWPKIQEGDPAALRLHYVPPPRRRLTNRSLPASPRSISNAAPSAAALPSLTLWRNARTRPRRQHPLSRHVRSAARPR